MLNHCFDDIEKFVGRLQQAAESFKELDRRRQGRNAGRHGPGGGEIKMLRFYLDYTSPVPIDDQYLKILCCHN